VDATGFWQVHPGAADALSMCVNDFAAALPDETALDLYSGVGLFAAGLAAGVGPGGRVVAVEGNERACRDARRNLHDLSRVEIVHADVRRWLGRGGGGAGVHADIAVLDPPRSGAGKEVAGGISRTGVSRVIYVSCEPTTLVRDLNYFTEHGLHPQRVRAFDCFPMTHHMETVVLLERAT
jgi:tRNA/tmRNA/rRNA uracil-C5-methylase (TrmA/RlmC/RlmD family)